MKKSMLMGALALMGAAMPTMAEVENGSFETGDFSKWSVRHGTTKESFTANPPNPAKFNLPISWTLWQDDVTWTGYYNWPGKTNGTVNGVVAKEIPSIQTYNLAFNKPLEGVFQAVLNYNPAVDPVPLYGDNDVTHLATAAKVKAADVNPKTGKYTLYVNWAAMLENPSHERHEQPAFMLRLGRKVYNAASGTYAPWAYNIIFHAGDDQDKDGWKPLPVKRRDDAIIYAKTFMDKLPLSLNDSVSIDLVSIDCSQTGHGAMAFIDNVGFIETDSCQIWGKCKTDSVGLPCIFGKSSVNLSANAKVKSSIGSDLSLTMDADSRDTGTIFARGTFKQSDRSLHVGDLRISGTYDSSKSPYNQAKRIGNKSTNPFVFIPAQLPVFTVTPGAIDVMTYIGKGKTILQGGGKYRNLMANGDTLLIKAGVYHFASVTLNKPTVIVFDNSAGPIQILSQGKVIVDNIVNKAILPQTADPATNVLLYSNATNNYLWDAAISLQSGSTPFLFDALAPKGMIAARQATTMGYAHAKSIQVESGATFNCREGFTK